jgi:TonB family protein
MKRLLPNLPAFAIGIAILFGALPARTDSTDAMRHYAAEKLLHRNVFVRHAYSATYLHFNENGAILNGVRTGYWAESGAIYPTKVEVWASGVLHIEADRVAVAFDQRKGTWQQLRRNSANVVIEVQFSPAHLTPEQGERTIATIFAADIKDLARDLLPYWQPCITGVTRSDPHENGREFCFDKDVTPNMESHAPVPTDAPRGTGPVVPARAIDAPQPRFTEVAREMYFNGSSVLWLVVDEKGRPAEIYIISPAGYGLDDQAVNAIANWRFRPAHLNGKPVRVQTTVEISFRVPRFPRVHR